MRSLSALIILISVAITLLSIYLNDYANKPLSKSTEEIPFVIQSGMSFADVTDELNTLGVIKEKLPWEILGRTRGATNSIQAGEYTLTANLTPLQLLDKLIRGDVVQLSFTIIEGWTFKQLWEAVNASENIVHTVKSSEELLAKLDLENQHPEGWFYPDTYHFPAGTTDVEFFQRAYQHMVKVLDDEWSNKNESSPLKTPMEALIMASIIEKETSVEEERTKVAAVFVTRLKRGMRLQTDPTVIYGMGESYDGNIKRKDLKADTPYNTYVHKGLPPTPIALPSRASIAAALNPADTEVVYFVAKGDGTHHFSKTYEEHKKAVIKYQLNGKAGKYKADHKSK